MATWSDRIHWGVIEDARRRHRHERLRILVALVAIAAVAVVAYAMFGDAGTPGHNRAAASTSAHQSARTPVATTAARGFCWFPTHGTRSSSFSHHCVRAQPAELLPPGIVTVAAGVAPHDDPWLFSLQRVRADGLDMLCDGQTPEGSGQCFPYPKQVNSAHAGNPPLGANPAVWLTPGGEGTCWPPYHWQLISGLVMRAGLSVWFKTATGTRRIPLIRLDPRLGIPGGAFAAVITSGPVTLLARDAAGRLIYTAPVTNRGDKASYCHGLDGGYYSFPTQAAKQAALKPTVQTYPFGPWVRAT